MMDAQRTNNKAEVLPFEFATITEKFKKKAELELNETDENRRKCLTELKELIKNEKSFTSDIKDEFLLLFLRARKFRTKDAFSLLRNYYAHRVRYPSTYNCFSAEICTHAMNAHLCDFLPFRAPDGSVLRVIKTRAWNPEEISTKEFTILQIVSLEEVLKNPVTQISGVTVLFDVKEMSLSQLWNVTLEDIRCFVSGVQDAVPLRLKAIHVVNSSAFVHIMFAMARPFMKHKMRKRIFLHGDNFESLHKFLPVSVLPEEYGGTLGPFGNEKLYSSLLKRVNEIK